MDVPFAPIFIVVAGSLADHVPSCPPELKARLALVHVTESDDGRALAPGEWLVTRAGALRRWDGFVARGEGAAEAAQLEAVNRFAELEQGLPALRETVASAESGHSEAQEALTALQRELGKIGAALSVVQPTSSFVKANPYENSEIF